MTIVSIVGSHDKDLRGDDNLVVAQAYTLYTPVNSSTLTAELGDAAGASGPIGVMVEDGEAASLDSPSTLWVYNPDISDDLVISTVRAHSPVVVVQDAPPPVPTVVATA